MKEAWQELLILVYFSARPENRPGRQSKKFFAAFFQESAFLILRAYFGKVNCRQGRQEKTFYKKKGFLVFLPDETRLNRIGHSHHNTPFFENLPKEMNILWFISA